MADPVSAPVPPASDTPKEAVVHHAFRTYASDVAQLTGKPLPADVRNEPAPVPAPSPKPAPVPAPVPIEPPALEPAPAPPPPEPPHYDPPPATIIPKAPSTEESREAVLARLRQRAVQSPVPEAPAPVPIPKAPSTDESREQVLARLKAKAASPVAAPVPVAPAAPVPRAPEPSRVAAAAAAAPAPSPLHTYKSDFAGKSAQEGASRISVLAAQQDAPRTPGASLGTPNKTKIFVYGAGALLILAGIGSIYAAYRLATGKPVVPQELSIPSIIFADERSEIEGEGSELRDAFVALTNEPLSDGKVRIAYRTFSTTTPEGILSVPEDGGTLIAALGLPAPGILLRNVEPESVPGIISIAGETRPFLILRVSSYERSFAGMLDWEPTMETGLADFYPEHPAPVEKEEPVASTTMPNAPLPQTSFSFSDGFIDEVVANRDVRVLRDSDGRVLMLYGYRDKRTLIIARSPDAFAELVARLRRERLEVKSGTAWYTRGIMDTAPYRARLEEEKTRLEQELATVGRRNPANPADWEAVPAETGLEADSADTAEQIDGYETNTAILKDLETRYNEILAALSRLETGTYGICEASGEAIEPARLDADPAARTCVAHLNG